MSIEERITNLENRLDSLQTSFIQAQCNSVEVTARADEGKQANIKVCEIDPCVSDNSNGLFDVAALADENSTAIIELAEMIAEKEV